ncbi:MAG: c-type cytochrome domain-containing protein [Chthoniobacteraceae bacterium]
MRHLIPLLIVAAFTGTATAEVNYERQIAPILRAYCAGCHNDQDLEADLSVETFAQLREGGEEKGDPLKPGDPDHSFLIRSLEKQARPKMPPKDELQVPAAELAQLRQWIADGAPGPARDVSILKTLTVPKLAAHAGAEPVTAVAFSPDGKLRAEAKYGSVEIRESSGNAVVKTLDDLPGKVNALHFSPDGKWLVGATGITGLTGTVLLWDVVTGERLREFSGGRDTLYDAEFSPDGKRLATAGYDYVIRLWNVADGKQLREIDVHKGAVFDLAFDPSGKVLASASADGTVKLWRVADGLRLDTLNQPQGEQFSVAFTPDGAHILSTGADKRIHLWRFVSRDEPKLNPVVASRFAHESPITAMALSADGRVLFTAAEDRSLKAWSVPELVQLKAFDAQPDVIASLATMDADRVFATRMDGSTAEYALGESAPTTAPVAIDSKVLPVIASSTASEPAKISEAEPNDEFATAQLVSLPVEISGAITREGDTDTYRFHARAGEPLTLAINAARSKSKLDSRIEILTPDGKPVEQVVLQATRDSWFTFRGKDSNTSDDFRLQNWAEMELDQYLYANGEVVRLWLYPRGPDSGFKVYPGLGNRHTAFSTTPLTHPLGENCYIVKPLPAGSSPAPNGLPIFRLYYENDDDPTRRWGADSLLLFTAPADSEYVARVSDVRGFGAETDFNYTLTVRERRPDFEVKLETRDVTISPGAANEVRFSAERVEGFEGPIAVEIENLPLGFRLTAPIVIEEGQTEAMGVIAVAADAPAPDKPADEAVKITAHANLGDREVMREIGTLGDLQLGETPKVTLEILPGDDQTHVVVTPGEPLEFTIRPGQTITAKVRAVRHDFDKRIELGNEDSGRNLPHGVFVDNIGLNGLLIVEGQTERDFVITAAPIAKPGTRPFYLRMKDGSVTSRPAILRVVPAAITAANELQN